MERVNFDDALSATGFGVFNLSLVLLCNCLVTSMVFELFSVGYLVVGSACELLTTSAEQGLMAAMPTLGTLFTAHLWGYLADTKGRRKALIISLALTFTGSLLSALSPNWIVLAVLKFFSSSAVAGILPVTLTLLSEFSPVKNRSALLMLVTGFFLLAPGLMAVIALPVLPLKFSYNISALNISLNSWRLLSLIFALPSAISLFGICFCPESPKFLASMGKYDEALDVLRQMFKMNNGRSESEFQVKSLDSTSELRSIRAKGLWRSIKAHTGPLIRPPYLKNTIKMASIIVTNYLCGAPYMMWLPMMADGFTRAIQDDSRLTFCEMLTPNIRNHTTTSKSVQPGGCVLESTAMLMVLATYTMYALLNVTMTGVIKFVPRKTVVIILQLTAAVSGYAINFVRGWKPSAALMVLFLCPMINSGIITTFSVNLFPTHLRAMAVSLTLMAGRVSAVVGIQVLNYLLGVDCNSSFYLFSTIALVGAIAAAVLPGEEE